MPALIYMNLYKCGVICVSANKTPGVQFLQEQEAAIDIYFYKDWHLYLTHEERVKSYDTIPYKIRYIPYFLPLFNKPYFI